MSDIREGDLVFIGPPAPLDAKIVWKVVRINPATEGVVYATVRSGMTERVSVVPIERLTKYTPRVLEPANG